MKMTKLKNYPIGKISAETKCEHYNTKRLNSAIQYLTPDDVLMGRVDARLKERQQKLDAARQHRVQAQAL